MGPSSGGSWWSFVLVFAFVSAAAQSNVVEASKTTVHCSGTASLSSKYFVPFYEAHREVLGCSSRERSPEGWQVHVVRIETSSEDVLLTVNDDDKTSKGLVLLLDSPSPVRWRLTFHEDNALSVYATLSSEIYSSNVEPDSVGTVEAVLNGANSTSPTDDFVAATRARFGAITTYSRISGANRISIHLPHEGSLLRPRCEAAEPLGRSSSAAGSHPKSSAVFAYKVTKKSVAGCFHAEQAGKLSTDVHVVDLVSAEDVVLDDPSAPPPAVYLSLIPEASELRRNLSLVLISKHPVRWFLESRGLSGRLHVMSTNGPVENYSLSAAQDLIEERVQMPAEFDKLWKAVIAKTGALPMSYLKVETANVMSMIVPSNQRVGLTAGGTTDLSDNKARLFPDSEPAYSPPDGAVDDGEHRKTVIIPGKMVENPIKQKENEKLIEKVERILAGHMSKECSQTRTVVAIPLSATDPYRVVGMTLNEPHCQGAKNATHWILKTKSTSCGSLNAFHGPYPTLNNNIYLNFPPGSTLHKLEVRLPFSCKFQPGFGGSGVASDEDYEAEEFGDDDVVGSGEMYKMRILRRPRNGSAEKGPRLILSQSGKSATVYVGDQVTVSTEFDSKSSFGLSIERCWLSDHGKADVRAANDHMWLLWKGCPPRRANANNVTLVSTAAGDDRTPSFVFDVTKQHLRMRKIFIFCVIGLCSQKAAFAQGNVGLCLKPSEKCAAGMDHESPAAQQLTKRGPLFVDRLDARSEVPDPFPSVVSDYSENSGSPSLHSSHVVMVGVPPEIAVGIALSSFAIGAILTGALCCLLHRKKTPKDIRTDRFNGAILDLVSEGSELQSMISSPTTAHSRLDGATTTASA